MAKYVIEIPYEVKWIQYIQQTGHGTINLKVESVSDLIPYTEPDRKAVEDEVWDFVSSLIWSFVDREILGMDIALAVRDMTYQEAKAKHDAWRKQKEEIRVGDEVEYICPEGICRFVVFAISGDMAYGFKYPREVDDFNEYCEIAFLTKTGRHFPEVEKLVEKMSRRDILF